MAKISISKRHGHTRIVTGKLVYSPGGNKGSGPAIETKKKEQNERANKCSCKVIKNKIPIQKISY